MVLTDETSRYVWGLGLAYATNYAGPIQQVYHTDGIGSVRALTDASGNVTQTYQTDEFGAPALTQGTSTQAFRFTGEPRDAETSFVNLRARYYVPSLGRFLSRDPSRGSLGEP